MYVRWRQRWRAAEGGHELNYTIPLAYSQAHGHYTLDAVLVESTRVNGKVLQRHIAHLGSVHEDSIALSRWEPCDERDIGLQAEKRAAFWCKAERRLARLALDATARAHIEAALANVVPRPPAAIVASSRHVRVTDAPIRPYGEGM